MKVRKWNFHNSLEVDRTPSGDVNFQVGLHSQCPLSPSMVHCGGGGSHSGKTQLIEESKQVEERCLKPPSRQASLQRLVDGKSRMKLSSLVLSS